MKGWFRRTGSEVLGWSLVALGGALLVLPGPGALVLVAGVALLVSDRSATARGAGRGLWAPHIGHGGRGPARVQCEAVVPRISRFGRRVT